MKTAATLLQRTLEVISVGLLLLLASIVVIAVVFRYILNDSLPWYDEVASVLLAWITYFGAALAAQKRAHMGFSSFVLGLPMGWRLLLFWTAEIVVYVVFITLAWAGWRVLAVMSGMSLESVPWASLQVVQGVIPVGCALIVVAQMVSTPEALARVRAGHDAEQQEIEQEIARAEADWQRHPAKER